MTEHVEVLQSNLTYVVSATDGTAQIAGSIDELEPIMRDPLPIAVEDEEHLMFASASDQLVLEIQAPKVILRDSGGGWPISPRFASGVSGLHDFMDRFSLRVPAFGWNLEFDLPRASGEAMVGLLDTKQLSALSGGDAKPSWTPSLIRLVSQDMLDGAGTLTLSMESNLGADGTTSVRFSMNAHFDRAPGIIATQPIIHSDEILAKGQAFCDKADELIGRLSAMNGDLSHGHNE